MLLLISLKIIGSTNNWHKVDGKDLAVFHENSKNINRESFWIYLPANQHSQYDPNVVKKEVKKRSPVEISHRFLYDLTHF